MCSLFPIKHYLLIHLDYGCSVIDRGIQTPIHIIGMRPNAGPWLIPSGIGLATHVSAVNLQSVMTGNSWHSFSIIQRLFLQESFYERTYFSFDWNQRSASVYLEKNS